MVENRIHRLVLAGTLSALVIVLGSTGIGFIPLPLASITILQVPVIIGAVLAGPLVGFFTGLLFGIFSVIQAAFIGVSPFDLAFLRFPWIAIVPRIFIGPVAWLFYALVNGSLFSGGAKEKAAPPQTKFHGAAGAARETAAAAVAGITGSLANTVLVLGAFALTVPKEYISALRELVPGFATLPWFFGIVSFNGLVEAGFSAAITLAVVLSWKGISRRNKSRLNS